MSLVETDDVAGILCAPPPPRHIAPVEPIRVSGKFFFAGEHKHFVKGVTYGPFPTGSHGAPFPEPATVDKDFALMGEAGINTVRVFTVPPVWLLDAAEEAGLRVLAGLPWPQHVTFLDNPAIQAEIRAAVVDGVRACRRHPAIFAYLVGNEIPPDMIRWHGAEPVRRFLRGLVACVRREHPEALVSYANFPSTEYLTVDFTDFVCFNVYLHDETAFRRYVARLHNLAVDRPLVLTEFGVDSIREGAEGQRRVLSWQVRTAFETGVAGTCVFAWTDEWFTGGHLIEDWAFGLVDRERRPKPSLLEVERCYSGPLPPPLPRYPRVSVVVCAYNAERTMDACLASLAVLNYPDYEVIVVNDGSRDRTLEIAEGYPYLPDHQPAEQGLERRPQRRRRGRDRRDRRLHRQRLRRRPRLADLSRRQDGGEPARRLRRPEFSAAREQPRAGRGRGGAGRPDPCAAERRGRRAHRRLQHGVPPRRPARPRRLRPGLSRRRRRCRHLLAVSGCRLRHRLQPGRDRLAFPPQHGQSLLQPAARLRQGRGARLFEASVPLQPVRPGEMARPHLWRPVDLAAAVAPAGDLFRRVRARPVPDPVRAALVADRVFAADLRMECRRDRAGAGRHRRRRLVVAARRAAARHLGDVRQRRAEGADRQALYRAEGARRWWRC